MNRVRAVEIMSTPVISARPEDTIPRVVRTMRRHAISGMPVVDDNGRLVGVITEGDILLKQGGAGGLPELAYGPKQDERILRRAGQRAEELMVRQVVTAAETTTVRDVACLMNRHGINRVPILREGELVGIVTRSDILSLFDRPPGAIVADVRRALAEDLLVDPGGLDIVVRDGVVSLAGVIDPRSDIRLIESVLGEMDGIAGIDTSGLKTASPLT